MRIALFSDVHGNLTALHAVVGALQALEPCDHVAVAGDHLWGGARPREVWSLMRAAGWLLVRGNEDEALVAESVVGGPEDHGPYRGAYRAFHAWTRARLDAAILAELASLPFQHRLATPAGDLLVVHSSLRGTNDRCNGPRNTLAELRAGVGDAGASAIAFGHYHGSFVRPTPFGLAINVASVGLPWDGRPLAAYSILTATDEGWVVEQRHVPYDAEEEREAARAVGLPAWSPDPA
jgi:predicted phosphodiesterase